jgi:antitoxin (DNA-binding transcriptional repressor) of toxin-antitoxin stability system
MKSMNATELAKNLSRVLDSLATQGDAIVIERNQRQVALLLPGPGQMNAVEAMGDLYQTLPERAAKTWENDARSGDWKGETLEDGVRDAWLS